MGSTRIPRGRLLLLGAVLCLLGTAVAPAAAHGDSPSPEFVVGLDADGDGQLTIVYTFDLETDAEADAFEGLRNDTDARERFRSRFEARMWAVANATANRTGRDVAVSNVSMDLRTEGTTGVVEMGLTWTNLAAVEDGRLVVTEPFASGFQPDRRFVLRSPEGYEIGSVSPPADDRSADRAIWEPGTNLEGFEATVEPAGTPTPQPTEGTPTPETSPGFGALAALAGLLGGILGIRRFR